jgi:hypothetical protein
MNGLNKGQNHLDPEVPSRFIPSPTPTPFLLNSTEFREGISLIDKKNQGKAGVGHYVGSTSGLLPRCLPLGRGTRTVRLLKLDRQTRLSAAAAGDMPEIGVVGPLNPEDYHAHDCH